MKIHNSLPLVSIVILTYNNGNKLMPTLESVLFQDYPNIEIIISDDASTEKISKETADEIAGKCSEKNIDVKFYNNSVNVGVVKHSNKAFTYCSGEYIKFLPPNDTFNDSRSLALMVDYAVQNNAQIITSCANVQDNISGADLYRFPHYFQRLMLRKLSPKKLYSMLAVKNFISAIGTMYRREFFENGGYDETYKHLDDWATWLKAFRSGMSIPFINEVTVNYSLGGISSSNQNAFNSGIIHDDMITLYEREIFPYKKQINCFAYGYAKYKYGVLKNDKSLGFKFKYFLYIFFDKLKCFVKKSYVKFERTVHKAWK